ncbi:cytochrome P450 [Sphingobium sp. 15-1]|uniref:cytochrome P450 n=1 Tax=Sphingobium sp. 15-1 TaxID=2729616 RepID=UPI00159C2DFB|nr:cytochrome P450 [Sphingobium sp. 15-1]
MQEAGERVSLAVRPDHVPPSLVIDFNMYSVPGGAWDAQAAFHTVQLASPDIFWTPHNGGHWVATRAEDVEMMLRDPARFSSKRVFLPRDDNAPRSLPLETDPPLHTELRKPLSRALFPKIVDDMEPRVRQLVDDLIDELIGQGECDFVADFANIMPMNIFLDLVDLPREERHRLLPLVEKFIKGGTLEARQEAQQAIFVYVTDIVRARRANPGNDLASIVVNASVGDEMISEMDAISYMTLILFGGLDTIAAMLSYITLFLATHPEHRATLIERLDDDRFVRDAMEELFRRFGIVQAARVIQEDFEYKGVTFRKNDTILPINMLCGLDDRRVDNPLEVRFDRERPARHLAFGAGPHSCPGATLARREIGIFLREWLRRIPDFSLKPGAKPFNLLGVTCGLETLELVWPTAGNGASS